MRVKINLVSYKDIVRFTNIVSQVEDDVTLKGKDENGHDWYISAKSLLCSLMLEGHIQNRKHTAHDVDWNTIWCECDKDIYSLISNYVVGGEMVNNV